MPPPNKQFYSYLGQQQQQQHHHHHHHHHHRRGMPRGGEDDDDDVPAAAAAAFSSPDDGGGGGVVVGAGGGDTSTYMQEAQRLKHDADRETDRERQAMKYLRAVLYFSLNANFHEQSGDKASAFTIYRETLNLIK